MPAVTEEDGESLRVPAALDAVDDAAEPVARSYAEGDYRGREHEKHRDEDDLRRDGRPGSDLELDSRSEGEHEHEQGGGRRREWTLPPHENRHRRRGDEKPTAEAERRPAL